MDPKPKFAKATIRFNEEVNLGDGVVLDGSEELDTAIIDGWLHVRIAVNAQPPTIHTLPARVVASITWKRRTDGPIPPMYA